MKNFYPKPITSGISFLLLLLLFINPNAQGQSATSSVPFSVGRNTCTGSTAEIHYYNYNAGTNTLADIAGDCRPLLRRGSSNFTFTSNLASVSYNPKDQNLYYLYTQLGSNLRTWIWRWPVGTCPTSSSPRLDTIRSFAYDILGVTFDKDGTGYMIEFSTGSAPYTAFLRTIDFVTGTYGQADTLELTGGVTLTETGTGDLAISPSGQMYFAIDNKLFTPDYKNYGGPGKKITATYLGPVVPPTSSAYLVGLTFSEGQLIASYSGSGCPYREINPLTGEWTNITRTGGTQSTSDFASVVSGIGAAKQLVSYTPTGTPNQYDVVYDIYVRNYGNYPLTNVQVNDTLSKINGASNFSLNSVTFMENPAGLVLNPSFNGSTNTALLNGTGGLPNYPATSNYARIRVSVRLSNIASGVVYNNQAFARARGYNSVNLIDASTNGTSPDLNSNDKPDDVGEDQPTPFLISITAFTPPCPTLGTILYQENFGSGSNSTALTGGSNTPFSGYTASTTAPLPTDRRILASNPQNRNASHWVSMGDHTTGSGRMLMVNADASNQVFYGDDIGVLCANQQYSLFFYAAFPGNSAYSTVCDAFGGFKYPRVQMRIRDAVSGAIITQISTPDITSSSWSQFGMKFVMPSGFSNIIFELINDAQGGCGNDILIDDIQFGLCDPEPQVSVSAVSAGCLGGSTTFTANLTDGGVIPGDKEYQWQISTNNSTWSDISGAINSTYTIPSVSATDINKYYRVIVAAQGNMSSASCRFTSSGMLLNAKTPSVAPTSVTASRSIVCPGENVLLTRVGGSLGTNATWNWYADACGGTPIGTGNTLSVNPSVTTTYYVRAEGDCNSTACAAVTITVACDIDKDDDGIPDTVEHNGIDPFGDDDNDGIANYQDSSYPGFTDANNDGINDQFDYDLDGIINALDLDSDNDGIPDVVEAGGVDANGDGRIDNYSDTDNDGFSDNVDGNTTGHIGSGVGLGLPDLDGDGIPNMFDLDSDNDGIPDVVEAGGTDADNNGIIDGYSDSDADGFSDNVDGDVGNDGISENAAHTLLRTGADTNGDGRADSYPYTNFDGDSKPDPYDLDSDNDGITYIREAGFTDANSNGMVDGVTGSNGWDNAIEAMPALNLRNSDFDPNPDYKDIDSDNDGIPDNVEGMATNSYRLPLFADSDGDGIDDRYDTYNGFGGNGITPNDQDGDGIPDYRDTDTDSDGALDIIEGNDLNFNCLRDDAIMLTGIDTDGDGLDDLFDLDNASVRSTSAYMGHFGSFSGDATPGSRSVVGQCVIGAPDRDWRYQPFALEADFIRLHARGTVGGNAVNWTISCDKVIDVFEIERSMDGIEFSSIASVTAPREKLLARSFSYTDKGSPAAAGVFYRIKAISADKYFKLSETIHVNANPVAEVKIGPNPAMHYLNITLQSAGADRLEAAVYDSKGQVVLTRDFSLTQGLNVITLNGLGNFTNGLYYLKLKAGSHQSQHKFILRK